MNVEPSEASFSNVMEMWYIVPGVYGAIELSIWLVDWELTAENLSLRSSVPCVHASMMKFSVLMP